MNQRGFVHIFVLLVILSLIIAGSGVYFLSVKGQSSFPSSRINQNSQTSANIDRQIIDDIDSLHVNLHRYYADNKAYPPNLDQLASVTAHGLNIYTNKDRIINPITGKPFNYTVSVSYQSYKLSGVLSNGNEYTGNENNQKKIYDDQIRQDFNALKTALEDYYLDNDKYPADLTLLYPNYLFSRISTNPYTLQNYSYSISSDGKSYMLSTQLTDGQIYSVTSPQYTAQPEQHCGGFIKNAPQCPQGYHCQLGSIPDTGGTCVQD